jgi:hypothetical protein
MAIVYYLDMRANLFHFHNSALSRRLNCHVTLM